MSIENRVVPKPVKRRRALAALCLSSASIRYKLLANVAINGMSALPETKNGFADANPYAHEAARMLAEEAIVVANACGCTLEHDAEPARRLFHVPYGGSFLTQSGFCTMLYIKMYK